MDLILASTSPYRRALLQRLGVAFQWADPKVDERKDAPALESPRGLAERLALLKAKSVAAREPQSVVIGGDQVACLDAQVLHKPGSFEKAKEQLSRLSGREHQLITAMVVISPEKEPWLHVNTAYLTLRNLTAQQIERYLRRDQPFDCAGSYKIEEGGIALMQSIRCDDPTAIQGLPLMALAVYLNNLNFATP